MQIILPHFAAISRNTGASPFSFTCPGFFYVHYTTHGTYSFTSHPKDEAIMVKCLAQGHKRRDRLGWDSNPLDRSATTLHQDTTTGLQKCQTLYTNSKRLEVYPSDSGSSHQDPFRASPIPIPMRQDLHHLYWLVGWDFPGYNPSTRHLAESLHLLVVLTDGIRSFKCGQINLECE